MSNLYVSKPLNKPLKGGQVYSNVGTFDVINASSIKIESVNIEGLFEDGILSNVIIQDSEIKNTIIGINGPNEGYFTTLNTTQDVTFESNFPDTSVTWDPNTGEFHLNSTSASFINDGCSYLGNIEICKNYIRAINTNGDINVYPNGNGSLNVNGQIYNTSSVGNFYSETLAGGVTFTALGNVLLQSSAGTGAITTNGKQTYTTVNGDIQFNVDTGITSSNLNNVRFSSGSIRLTTPVVHNLQAGDVISVTSPSLNGFFTVGNVVNSLAVTLTTTTGNADATVTGGNFIKSVSNNIVLNTQSLVKIPINTKLTFGDTCNNIWAGSGGIYVNSCSDINLSGANVKIPQSTPIRFGTSGSNYIVYDNTNAIRVLGNELRVENITTTIDSTNIRIRDPIVTLANYTNVSNDGKDRGVEFQYYDTQNRLGWFGYKNTTGRFTFITNATNTNEVITGDIGSLELANLTLDNITLSTGGIIQANCGKLLGVSLITGCSNNLTIAGSENVTITTTNRLSLQSGVDILVPGGNIPLRFGTSGSSISESTVNSLILSGVQNVRFSTASRGAIIVPTETYVSFDGSSIGTQRISSNTTGELIVASNRSIYLTTTGGNIIVPANTSVQFGGSSQTINGNTGGINISSTSTSSGINLLSNSATNITSSFGNIVLTTLAGDITLNPTIGNVRVTRNRLVFGASGTSNSIRVNTTTGAFEITGSSTNTIVLTDAANINLSATDTVAVPNNTRLRIGSTGGSDIYTDNSFGTWFSNTNSSGTITINAPTTQLFSTGGNIRINTSTCNATVTTLTITGTTGSLTQIDTSNVRIRDPIITVGDYSLSTSDGKDRGLEYRYTTTSGSTKLGWWGRKDTTERLTFYSDAVNTNEVITGTLGNMEMGSIYVNNNLVFNGTSGGALDMSCGTIANVNTVSGCSGVLNLRGANEVNISATGRIGLPFDVPLQFGSSSNSFTCDTSGNLTVSTSKVIFNSDVQINGTTLAVYSTVTNVQDPIVSIGGVTGPIVNDGKDRGIEVKWTDGIATKTGFFGYKQSADRFVFIKDGTNTNEVFSGAYGDVGFGNAYLGNVLLSNGNISGVNTISGGAIILQTTSGNISLTPTSGSNVILPANASIAFGNTTNAIRSDTAGNLMISGGNSVSINTTSFIRVPENVPMYWGTGASTYIIRDTSGNLNVVDSVGNINLTPQISSGSVNIPTYNYLAFGSTRNSILSDGDQLYLNGYNGISLNSSTVNISGNVNIVGTITATTTDFDINKYILPLGTYQLLTVTSIVNTSGTNGNISVTTSTDTNFRVGDTITLQNTDTVPDIDGTYTVTFIAGPKTFYISKPGTVFTTAGTTGTVKSDLMTYQGKDVGIGVNYWSTVGNLGVTSGSLAFKTGFFGFKNDTQRWSFYTTSTINNNVVSGQFGDIEVNKVHTSRMSGFSLDGTVSCGSNLVDGSNFNISGGEINGTEIGTDVASTGRFTTLRNTTQALLNDVSFQSSMSYTFERYTMRSDLPASYFRSPTSTFVVSLFSVVGTSFTSSSGTMPSTGIADGTFKILVCGSMGTGCTHTIFFGDGKLIAPNPINPLVNPTRLLFKRRSQSAQMIYDAIQNAWILLSTGCYVV